MKNSSVYIVVAGVIVIVGIIGAVVMFVVRADDAVVMATLIFALIVGVVGSLLQAQAAANKIIEQQKENAAVIVNQNEANAAKLDELHVLSNSRLSEAITKIEVLQRVIGQMKGAADESGVVTEAPGAIEQRIIEEKEG